MKESVLSLKERKKNKKILFSTFKLPTRSQHILWLTGKKEFHYMLTSLTHILRLSILSTKACFHKDLCLWSTDEDFKFRFWSQPNLLKLNAIYTVVVVYQTAPRCTIDCKLGGCIGTTGACFGVCYCIGVSDNCYVGSFNKWSCRMQPVW